MEGYPQIAQLMSHHGELTILRRFNKLNILNLLYMQAELMHLEEKYQKLSEIEGGDLIREQFRSRDWWSLTQPDSKGKTEKWDTILEIREKLREYRNFNLLSQFMWNISFSSKS